MSFAAAPAGALGRSVRLSDEETILLNTFLQSQRVKLIPGVTVFESHGVTMRKRYSLDAAGQWWVSEKSATGPLLGRALFSDSGR